MANPSVTIDLVARDKRFNAAMTRLQGVLRNVAARMQRVSQAARRMLLVGGLAMAGLLKAASDYEETISKFKAVFKDQSDAAQKWSVDTARVLNRSRTNLLAYMATLQDTFVPFGFARDRAFELSKQITQLGIDLASFNNMADSEAIQLLTSALVGNHEAVRRFGVLITQATLNQKLFQMGIAGGTKAATEQEKVLARIALLLEMTSDAQGDAARTAESFANQLKGLTADVTDLAVALGQIFIPRIGRLLELFRRMTSAAKEWIAQNVALARTLGDVALGVGAVTFAVAGLSAALATLGFGAAGLAALSAYGAKLAVVAAVIAKATAVLAVPALVGGIVWAWVDQANTIKRAAAEAEYYNERLAAIGRTFRDLALNPTLANQLRAWQDIRTNLKDVVKTLGDAYQPMLDNAMRRVLEIQLAIKKATAEPTRRRDILAPFRGVLELLRTFADLNERGQQFNDQLQEQADRIKEITKTTHERVQEELKLLEILRLQGLITEQDYARRRKQLAEQAAQTSGQALAGTFEALTATHRRIQQAALRRADPTIAPIVQTAQNTKMAIAVQEKIARAIKNVLDWLKNIPQPGTALVGIYGP